MISELGELLANRIFSRIAPFLHLRVFFRKILELPSDFSLNFVEFSMLLIALNEKKTFETKVIEIKGKKSGLEKV